MIIKLSQLIKIYKVLPLNFHFGLAVSFFIIFFSILSVFWTPHDITVLQISSRFKPVGDPQFILGSDHFGRDIFSMLMLGAKTSLMVAFSAIFIGLFIGIPLGLLAASKSNGSTDEIIMRSNDLIFAFPALVIAILITAIFGPSMSNAIIAIGIFNIPVFARVTRGAALSIFTLDYVLAAKVCGKNTLQICWEHVLPNISSILIVQSTIQFSLGILAEAGLSYVGLGAQPPIPSWGKMLADSQTMISFAPHLALAPGLTIIVTVLAINLMGDGLRDYLDPKSYKEPR
jgi:peptide/nickel transport system permease protein